MSISQHIAAGALALLLLNACGTPTPSTDQPSAQPSASSAASAEPSPASSPAATPAAATPNAGGGRVSSAGRILFSSDRDGNEEIYLLNVDGSGEFRLTTNDATDVNPAWSPDGTRIVFMSTRDGDPEIYVMNTDGGEQTRLTTSSSIDTNPVWSPDGKQIAFVSDRDGNPDIFVINADGSEPRNLTQNPERDFDPAWSPDGTRIVFASYRDAPADKSAANDLYSMNADGSEVTRLTDDLARNSAPAFSPDGTRIAFDYFDGGGIVDGDIAGGEIYLMNADGTNQQRLTSEETGGRHASWSADGARIAFASARNDKSTFEIFTIDPDGSDLVKLTDNPAGDFEPAYAPAP